MWLRHWQLAVDPFSHAESAYIATPTHETVLARITSEVVGGTSVVGLTGGAGVGKTTLARELARRLRTPRRRTLVAHDAVQLSRSLARVGCSGYRAGPQLDFYDIVRVLRLESLSLLLVVDGLPPGPILDRLLGTSHGFSSNLCLLLLNPNPTTRVLTTVRLRPLTRSEAATYLNARLSRSGRDATTFCPEALARLHAESGGCPRSLNQLARESLIHSAARSETLVSSQVVREVSRLAGPAGWYEHLRVG